MQMTSDIQQKIERELDKYPNIKLITAGNRRLYESLTWCRYQLPVLDHEYILFLSSLIPAHPRCKYQLPDYDYWINILSEVTLAGALYESFKEQNNTDISGLIIYGIPLQRQFTNKLKNLEKWLSSYSGEYRTERFGKLINIKFIDHYSEIQFYDKLVRFGRTPSTNITLGIGATNLDFKISPFSRDIFIEVTIPLLSRKYEEQISEDPENCTGFGDEFGFFDVTKIIRDTICDKIKNQFKKIGSDENCVILAINVEYLMMTPFAILNYPEKIFDFLFPKGLPKYVYGLILFCTDQSRFFINPRYHLTTDEIMEFQKFCDDENSFVNRLKKMANCF